MGAEGGDEGAPGAEKGQVTSHGDGQKPAAPATREKASGQATRQRPILCRKKTTHESAEEGERSSTRGRDGACTQPRGRPSGHTGLSEYGGRRRRTGGGRHRPPLSLRGHRAERARSRKCDDPARPKPTGISSHRPGVGHEHTGAPRTGWVPNTETTTETRLNSSRKPRPPRAAPARGVSPAESGRQDGVCRSDGLTGPAREPPQAVTLKVRTRAKLEEQAFLAQRREGGRMNRPTGLVGNREPTKTPENNATRGERKSHRNNEIKRVLRQLCPSAWTVPGAQTGRPDDRVPSRQWVTLTEPRPGESQA